MAIAPRRKNSPYLRERPDGNTKWGMLSRSSVKQLESYRTSFNSRWLPATFCFRRRLVCHSRRPNPFGHSPALLWNRSSTHSGIFGRTQSAVRI